ncbi:hypothetical protein BDF14DRAFT_1796064 [Spinellus fusiger]|nr:hypothetical protein BDF14DRAFT_1796064 [Spinellus fusiger]
MQFLHSSLSCAEHYGYAKNGALMKIDLDQRETQICDLLRNVSLYLKAKYPILPVIVPRIAGGWVRDKLLGKTCHDLDIAVNDMMGYEFAQHVNLFLQENDYPTRNIAKIDSNPEKSKHLETATTKLFGQEIDFCNLRTEIYSQDSRIPSEITFGTPLQDAYRRDITMNSLFYNINTSKVEDFTEKGLSDLAQGLIRTPLAPFETFKDDPLRVLRCIRFTGRFDFVMMPELREAAKHPEIKEALMSKISRERIGQELEKMLMGPRPFQSLLLIHQLELYPVVFMSPENVSGTQREDILALKAAGVVYWLSNTENDKEYLSISSQEELRTLYLGASLLPLQGVMTQGKNKLVPSTQVVLRDSIKTNNASITTVSTIIKAIPMIQTITNKNYTSEGVTRSELGMIIRELGSLWTVAVKLSLISELLESHKDIAWSQPEPVSQSVGQTHCAKYSALIKKAHTFGIETCYTWKHQLDGKRVAALLGIRPGPQVASILNHQMVWQLEQPNGTEEECAEAIQKYWQTQSKA